VLGKLRYIVSVDVLIAFVNLGINLLLIPRYGAMGAAVGTMSTMIFYNLLKQIGLVFGTGIRVVDPRYLRMYATIILGAVGLLALEALVNPPVVVGIGIAALMSVLVLRLNHRLLNLETMFPELLRVPLVRRLFGG